MKRIGVIGCGQLARMLALEGKRMGMDFVFLAVGHEDAAPIQSLATTPILRWNAANADIIENALRECDVVTTEREDIPQALLDSAHSVSTLHPNRNALHALSRRDRERDTVTALGLDVSPFVFVHAASELSFGADRVGFPVVIKSVFGGYDGRGQWRAESAQQLDSLVIPATAFPLLVERRVSFGRELSITAVRARSGEILCYPLAENRHVNGILSSTHSPAPCDDRLEQKAKAWIAALMHSLDYVGVLTIELFDTGDDLLVNEIAPRVHNSAHWTFGGAMTSQFENHLRAITGAPLGATSALGYCGIVNILDRHPSLDAAWIHGNTRLHYYGKEARPGRKLGHVLVMDCERDRLTRQLHEIEQRLLPRATRTNHRFLTE